MGACASSDQNTSPVQSVSDKDTAILAAIIEHRMNETRQCDYVMAYGNRLELRIAALRQWDMHLNDQVRRFDRRQL